MKEDFIFRLEGEEDLDVLDKNGSLLYAIQLKNLGKTITLSDILSDNKTSFIKRFLDKYPSAIPILVSYGEINAELKNWTVYKDSISEKDKATLKKYRIAADEWKLVKSKTQFKEINEGVIAEEVKKMMKESFSSVDPIPTIGFMLNWLQFIAEKQQPITTKEFYRKVEDFAKYISERISIHEQYGLVLKPLHKVTTEGVNQRLLEKEFYNATLTRYEHILLGLEVNRENYLEKINEEIKEHNTIILKGASGQGKTALLYSYVNQYINDWLSFELKIQQDPIITQKSIQAISSISKNLDIPAVFVININPNSTEWIQIIKESAHLNHIKFLVAIRYEDWYRATAIGIEFEYKEIDLSLSKEEAEVIYSRLNQRNKISHFADFDEAWIQIGSNTPLLEFVYSITQGDSLRNKLKQQVQQILKEDGLSNNQPIEFLRIVSLADSMGAKIDVSKLDSNFDYQFIIEKLENEYLIKKSADKQYIQGLHIVRSQKLLEILFNEYTNHKEEYGYKCISLLAEEDVYLFLVQLLYLEIFKPDQFISDLNKKFSVNDWSVYASIIKAFIWAGTREYVEKNREIIDECRANYGDAWTMILDFLFGTNYDRNGMLDMLNVDEEHRKKIDDINKRLSSNQLVYNLASNVINKLNYPIDTPTTKIEWKSFGETLFWLKNIPNSKESIPLFTDNRFEAAFKILDSSSLSKLMLGMHFYSPEMNAIRIKYAGYLVDRIKSDFDIIHLPMDEDEVSIHYIIDILKADDERSTNDFVVNILELLRTAFPEKKQFNSQGYGHRLQTLSVDYDPTHKTIPIESLPLEEWVNINSCIIKLYEYKNRPKDWNDYCINLNQWETQIKDKINEFNRSFDLLLKGSKTYAPVTRVMENIFFNRLEKIKEPKSIIDPLGIFVGKKKRQNSENEREQLNQALYSKFEMFFKSFSDFKGDIENFIHQSAQTLTSKIKLKTEEGHIHNENIERLSQVNLYNAINKLKEYNNQYNHTLGTIDVYHKTKIEINNLLTAATYWKDFLSDNTKGQHSYERIFKLKSDFENRIIRDCKQASKANQFSIQYINSKTTEGKPILLIDGENPFLSLQGMKEAYNIIQQAINNPEFTSLKYLMLQLWFSNIYFIQTVYNKSVNNKWNVIMLNIIKDDLLEELSLINFIQKPIATDILESLNIQSWAHLYPEFNEINKAIESYGRLISLVDHFYDLRLFDQIELKDEDQKNLSHHIEKIGLELQRSLQSVLDSVVVWLNMFPLDEPTYNCSEDEQEYFKALINIRDNIFPEPKGEEEDYQVVINMEIISKWIDRLRVCNENWEVFILLLYGKYVNKYK
ncbi:hypothetical protein [Sporocytophaga myxococcoides]|uniref:hypothetical protein n=1 Tax=Sporocytophaga myxococcoides TaxID=153721 RepID=UPI0004916948|nr:hypothetical protein [Sporocytophaga myxococcoides]